MTKCLSKFLAAGIALVLAQGSVHADTITLSFAPATGTNLNNVTAGDTVTIDVLISGLRATDIPIGELGVDVAVTPQQAGPLGDSIPDIVPDGIIPDGTGFTGASSPGSPQGTYDEVIDLLLGGPGTGITANGKFFTFQLSPTAPGTVALSFQSAAGFDELGNNLVIDSTNILQFDVAPAGVQAAPLPTPVMGGLVLLLPLALRRYICRRPAGW